MHANSGDSSQPLQTLTLLLHTTGYMQYIKIAEAFKVSPMNLISSNILNPFLK